MGALTVVFVLTASLRADAKASFESPYGYGRTWNAALRFVRVDKGWKLTEKDEESGYLLFEYKSPENSKPTPGAIELVRGHDSDAPVGVVVELSDMPHYHEQLMLDALSSKLRREYGEPPVRVKPPIDAGADEDGT